jgi:hypothetical protein
MDESPLFVRTYDLLLWLLPQVQKFPRSHRFGLAERIQRQTLDFQDALVYAGKSAGGTRHENLVKADVLLAQLRSALRLARDLKCLSLSQYEHVGRMVAEVGRLLGAWKKNTMGENA